MTIDLNDPWAALPSILARIETPQFPDRNFPITDYGVQPNGSTEATDAIALAIAACATAGGGHVVVPAGSFLTGPIVLQSNVDLHLSEGAVLRFVTEAQRYPVVLTSWEGIECYNFQPLISAMGATNIGLTGPGTLDGQAGPTVWWDWKPRQRPDQRALIAMGDAGTPVEERRFGPGHLLRPYFFQAWRCTKVLVDGPTFINSPMWEIHPYLCRSVTVRNVTIVSHGPNNDGCNPEFSQGVLIENCSFDTGDDCIAIKSGKNADGRRIGVASENIVVRGCHMKDGHGGVVLGSECSGHIRNVFVENCTMDSPNLDRMLRFKNNAVRGGVLENVFLRNVRVGRVSEAILTVDFRYEEGEAGPYQPVVRHVQVSGVTSDSSARVLYVANIPGGVIDDLRFADCRFRGVESAEVLETAGSVEFRNVTIEPKTKAASLSTREKL